MNRKQRRAEGTRSGGAPAFGRELLAEAVRHHQAGRLGEAEHLYRQILAADPRHADSLHLLGVVAHQVGRDDVAVDLIGKAVAVNGKAAPYHSNLGVALMALRRFDEAAASLRRAVKISPDYAEAHNNLGNVLSELRRFDEATASYGRALKVNPRYAEAHNNLGNAVRRLGRVQEAIECYGRALGINPDYTEAHHNLAVALRDLGRLDDAEASCRRALRIKPDLAEGQATLAMILLERGQAKAALECCLTALGLDIDRAPRRLFASCLMRVPDLRDDAELRKVLVRALMEGWGGTRELAWTAGRMVKRTAGIESGVARINAAWPHRPAPPDMLASPELAAAATDTVLHALLVSAPVLDPALERFLSTARHALLAAAGTGPVDGGGGWMLDFHCALAQQCFINEYVFDRIAAEARQAETLRDDLVAAVEAGMPVPIPWLVAVASYFPLHTLPGAHRLLERSWPEAVAALVTQQVREPEEERRLRPLIPRLTPIDDDVSQRVRQQYEESPYPRWVRVDDSVAAEPFDFLIAQEFPLAPFRPIGKVTDLDVLIAGCGSGRHAIEGRLRYAGARVLALDLSLTSLCYAKRKSDALSLDTISFAQADILQVAALGRNFDIVEACGVLHHLADPMAGWRALLALLRPGGVMRVALYSEVARRDVTRGRAFVGKGGYTATAEDVRRCRQSMMADGSFGSLTEFSDFFSLSECRDLLFHVQEHCFQLPAIAEFLDANGLRLLGFHLDRQVIQAYRKRFPGDAAATDLGQWQVFEEENPGTFRGMYEFSVQKAG